MSLNQQRCIQRHIRRRKASRGALATLALLAFTATSAFAQNSTFIEVSKIVSGNWPQYDGVPFTVHIGCHAMMPVVVDVPAGGSVLVPLNSDEFPPGSCTVSEPMETLPAPPDGYQWLAFPPQTVIPVGFETVQVLVNNRLRVGGPGPDSTLEISKAVIGGPNDMAGTPFTVEVVCDGGAPMTVQVPAGGSTELVLDPDQPLPQQCTITELADPFPSAPAGYAWVDSPPAALVVQPVGFEIVRAQIVNRLRPLDAAPARPVPTASSMALALMSLLLLAGGWSEVLRRQ